jgi:hypothetical protein
MPQPGDPDADTFDPEVSKCRRTIHDRQSRAGTLPLGASGTPPKMLDVVRSLC